MKKVLVIHHCGIIGGAGLSLHHILRSIDKEKYDITVLCPSNPKEMINILSKDKWNVIASETSPKIFNHYNGGIKHAISIKTLRNIYEILKDKKNIDNYIKDQKPDIVVVNSMTLCWIGKIAKRNNANTICFHRETYQKGIIGLRSYYIKRQLSKWFDKIIFISNNDLKQTGKIKSKTKVIYDKVEISNYENYDKKHAKEILGLDDSKYILYLGGMSKLKGAHVIIKAMKYINDKDVKLIFISDKDKYEKCRYNNCKSIREKIKYILNIDYSNIIINMIYDENLNNRIMFIKRTDNPELLYKACDIVVFPSTKPHQARPIYEAGISRIPIIISEFKETKEFAEDGVTAITFKKNNSRDLAKKINYIIRNEKIIREIVENNYQKAIKNHNFDKLKKELIEVFDV